MRFVIHIIAQFVRLIVIAIAHIIFRIKVKGTKNVPTQGGALVIANHVSFLDTFVICAVMPRMVGFVMLSAVYHNPLLNWLFKHVNMVPVSGGKSKEDLENFNRRCQEIINEGNIVCIFAEGQISRNGQLLGFKKGLEHIAKGISSPIIPVQIDGLIGTPLSHDIARKGTIGFHFNALRRKVRVRIGDALEPSTTAYQVRNVIKELEVENFEGRYETDFTLTKRARKVWKKAKKRSWCGRSLKPMKRKMHHMEYALYQHVAHTETIGVSLPYSEDTVILFWALARLGKKVFVLNEQQLNAKDVQLPQVIIAENTQGIAGSRVVTWDDINDVGDNVPDYKPAKLAQKSNVLAQFVSGNKIIGYTHGNFLAYWQSVSRLFELDRTKQIATDFDLSHPLGYFMLVWLPLLTRVSVHPDMLIHKTNTIVGSKDFINNNATSGISFILSFGTGVEGKFDPNVKIFEGLGVGVEFPLVAVNSKDFEGKGLDGRVLVQSGSIKDSVGRVLPGAAIRVVDSEGESLGPNEVGDFEVMGSHFPHAGWKPIGIRGYKNSDGFLFLD